MVALVVNFVLTGATTLTLIGMVCANVAIYFLSLERGGILNLVVTVVVKGLVTGFRCVSYDFRRDY